MGSQNKMIKARTILVLNVFFCTFCVAQSPPKTEIDIQSFVEEYFATQDADVNYEDLYESFFMLYSNPMNLNTASPEQIRSLNVLSEAQINALSNHINSSGNLLSLYELQSIQYFDQATIDRLLPFIKVDNVIDNRTLWQRIRAEENNYLIIRYEQNLQTRKGFIAKNDTIPAKYMGDQGKYYTRFRTNHFNDYSIGFTMEKDAGEQFAWDPSKSKYGSDFQSFHAQVQNKGIFKNLIIGDYQMQIGQGLISSAGFSIGKGAETINTVRRNHLGLRPYTSVVESGFFRGAAATVTHKSLDITAFYSTQKRDAILRTDTVEQEDFISSLQSSGLHRTVSELEAKNNINEQVIGTNILHTSRNNQFQFSMTGIYTQYEVPLNVTRRYYNQFDFSDDRNLVIGTSTSYQWNNFSFFGEAGRSQSGGIGALGGLLASLTPKLDFSFLLRHYDTDFHSFYGRAFGESTINKNENGTYWGIKYKHSRKTTFSAYYDRFRFPWLKSGIKAPSNGYEYLMRLQHKPSKTVNLYVQYREEQKSKSELDEANKVDILKVGTKRNLILNADYRSNAFLSMKTRFQMSRYHFDTQSTQGAALIQDVSLKRGKFTVSGRYALFQTDDYENRQYVYEKDVLYAFSIPAYSGRGSRNYLLLQYKHNRNWHFWIRYAVTHFRDRKKISSGSEEIDGNTNSAIKLQLRIKL